MKLTKAQDLAAEWDITVDELKRRVRRYGWPCVRLSRLDMRFTDHQIEQIVAMQSSAGTKAAKAAPTTTRTGQSRRSASRAS